tara:strand:- start:753 stop:1040 length:288 start_codon:yes stop_codon:yes gene_type:complete
MSKDKILLVSIPQEEMEVTLRDALDNSNVERGVCMRANIGKDVFKHFELLKKRGYFCVGMILEDGFNVEFLFQRHPKQTTDMKMVELKNPNPYEC